MRRPPLEKIWHNFKQEFTIAHQELRDTDASVGELSFSSANAIVAQIVKQLRAEVPTKIEVEPHVVTTTPSPLSDNLPTANAICTSDPAIASLVASMMVSMETMRA